jgi:uncharacterized protein (DUF58 family)
MGAPRQPNGLDEHRGNGPKVFIPTASATLGCAPDRRPPCSSTFPMAGFSGSATSNRSALAAGLPLNGGRRWQMFGGMDETASSELFDPAFVDRLRALVLRLRRRRQLKKKGMQSTPATGFTREFKDFRHYTPHDDYRAIDWRLFARLERLFIRLYEEVQEFHVHVLLDTSGSMLEPFPEKRVTALKLAAALSALGLLSQHRVSVHTMGGRLASDLPPLKGPANLQRIIDHLARLEFGGLTDLEKCFHDFRPSRQRYGIIFVISDLFGIDPESAPRALARTGVWPGEPHVVHLHHPLERSPGLEGEVELIDVESGERRRMWLTRREVSRYEESFDRFTAAVERECLSRRVDYVRWTTDLDFEETFLTLLSRGSALAAA